MEVSSSTKSSLQVLSLLIGCGIAFGGFGFGYKHIKDANFLNQDVSKVVYAKGVATVEVKADRAVISFSVEGSGQDDQSAEISFNANEKEVLLSLDKEALSKLRKLNIVQYSDESPVQVFYKSRTYEIVLDNSTEEAVAVVTKTLSATNLTKGLFVRYTLQDPVQQYQMLTNSALERAKSEAVNNVKRAGGKIGELVAVNVGTYNYDSQVYFYDNPNDFFYSMPGMFSEMTQSAYVSYKIK